MSRARIWFRAVSSGVAVRLGCCVWLAGAGAGVAQSVGAGVGDPFPSASRFDVLNDAAYDYALALEELRQGRHAAGQRRLEALIARHPDTALADEARARVAELYLRRSEGSGAVQRSGLGAPLPQSGGGWQVDVRRTQQLAEAFRSGVGDRVFFAAGSADIGTRAREALSAQARWLLGHTDVPVTVEGHADDPGGASENRVLAVRRAEAVRLRLIEEGVPPERIRLAAHGSDRRVALCAEAVCSAQNRGAITVIGDGATLATLPASAKGSGGLPR